MATADSSSVLREYLVALGFKVDEASTKKAESAVVKMDSRITGLAKGALTAAAAVQAMVTQFAFQMEKLHYASQRTQSTAGNIKALDYAFRQLGGSGDQIRSSLENMSRAMRLNPGLTGLLESLGVQVQGRDRADVLNDLVSALSKMPHYIGAQYAQMFGLDPDTLLTLQQNMAEFKKLQEDRKKMAAEAGVDMDQATEAGKKYAQALREIWERVGLLKDALAIRLLPAMQDTAAVINLMLTDLTRLVREFTTWADFAQRFKEGVTGRPTGGGVVLSEDSQIRLGIAGDPHEAPSLWQRTKEAWGGLWGGSKQGQTSKPPPPAAATSSAPMAGSLEEKQAYLASLELKYGLPAGWLDRVWKKESGRGTNMVSPKGALGHFQFMPDTAKQYGLKDPMNFMASADAAGRYFRDLDRMFGGDQAKMAAAYNWGQGNVMRKGLGAAPAETRDYVQSIAGITLYQNNPITVTGVSDPARAASLVEDAQRRTNNDITRNLSPGVR